MSGSGSRPNEQPARGTAIVRRYLDSVAGRDWGTAAGCLSEDVRRTGPFGDVYEGRDTYLAFLSDLMPTLAGYRMHIERVAAADGPTVLAELVETVEMGGKTVVTPEALVFDLDAEGRIREISIYIRHLS